MSSSATDTSRARPCPVCGYDLRGLTLPGRCPECGALATDTRHIPIEPWYRSWHGWFLLRPPPLAMHFLGTPSIQAVAQRRVFRLLVVPWLFVLALAVLPTCVEIKRTYERGWLQTDGRLEDVDYVVSWQHVGGSESRVHLPQREYGARPFVSRVARTELRLAAPEVQDEGLLIFMLANGAAVGLLAPALGWCVVHLSRTRLRYDGRPCTFAVAASWFAWPQLPIAAALGLEVLGQYVRTLDWGLLAATGLMLAILGAYVWALVLLVRMVLLVLPRRSALRLALVLAILILWPTVFVLVQVATAPLVVRARE